jgi:hypothetical protein
MFRLIEAMAIIFAFLSVGLSACLLGGWVLWPIERVARQSRVPWQFTLPDFFSLAFIIQLAAAPFAIMFNSPLGPEQRQTTPLIILALVLVAFVWCTGVRTLSRAGVRHGGRRFVFAVFVLPVTFVAAPALGPLVILTVMLSLEPYSRADVPKFMAIILGAVLAIALAKAVCRWVLADTPTGSETPPADATVNDPQ